MLGSVIPRYLVPERLKRRVRRSAALREWAGRDWSVPAPQVVKREVLDRYSCDGVTWVETGTWLGDTTAWLAARSERVHSIEPEATLAANATRRFATMDTVTIYHGTSEERFGPIVASLSGPVAFWLEGYYSGGDTFEGSSHTPIAGELESIGKALDRLAEITVFVDDFRCFEPSETQFADYPTRDHLVGWAVGHGLRWTVEHDIFIAWSREA